MNTSLLSYKFPNQVTHFLHILKNNGFKGYLVGGCVRDALLSLNSLDFDIITDAKIDDIKRIFIDFKLNLAGEKYGVIEIVDEVYNFQIATFRTEGEYNDFRHPKFINFVSELKDDLKRRDFTINALAFNYNDGIIDLFSGIHHLKNKCLKTIGSPFIRFREDPLRILRGLRFCSIYGFNFSFLAKISAIRNTNLVDTISNDRIKNEFFKMLCGQYFSSIFCCYHKIILRSILKHDYNNYKINTKYIDSLDLLFKNAPNDLTCRLVLFGYLTKIDITRYFNIDRKLKNQIVKLNSHILDPIPTTKDDIFYYLFHFGNQFIDNLINIKFALSFFCEQDRNLFLEQYHLFQKESLQFKNSDIFYDLSKLKICGDDLIKLGFMENSNLSKVLYSLLLDVNLNKIENNKERLLKRAFYYLDNN